jgi:hypothetical protein
MTNCKSSAGKVQLENAKNRGYNTDETFDFLTPAPLKACGFRVIKNDKAKQESDQAWGFHYTLANGVKRFAMGSDLLDSGVLTESNGIYNYAGVPVVVIGGKLQVAN